MTGSERESFLLATFEGGGAVAPFVTLARQLIARGHDVRIMSDACNRGEVEAAGAEFVSWNAAPSRPARGREYEFLDDWNVATAFEGFCLAVEKMVVGRAEDFAADIRAELKRRPASLAVINDMILGAMMGCEAEGQRFVVMSCNVCAYPIIPGIPPMGPGLPPATSDEERRQHAEIAAGAMSVFDSYLDRYNLQRARAGLAPLERLTDQLYAAEKFILATCETFDFAPETLPDFIAYGGPLLDDNGWSRPWTNPFPEDDTRPLVLVSFSTTFQNQASLLQKVMDALAPLPVRAVVTLGGIIREDEVRPAPNTAVVHSAPHNLLMKQASLVVTHGGHGTVMKALMHALPMLIIPQGRDQNDSAIRVTWRGAGLSLDPQAGTGAIRDALRRLLSEPGFAEAAASLAGRMTAETARRDLAGMVEKIAGEGRALPPPAMASLREHTMAGGLYGARPGTPQGN